MIAKTVSAQRKSDKNILCQTGFQGSASLLWAVAVFSVFVNMLMFTGPVFMLQIYDRVLSSGSQETLLALFLIVTFLFAVMAVLDHLRKLILIRIGARFHQRTGATVLEISMSATPSNGTRIDKFQDDLRVIQRIFTSNTAAALFDLPWTPVFVFGIALFHPWLGLLAAAGVAVFVLLAVANNMCAARSIANACAGLSLSDKLTGYLKLDPRSATSDGIAANALARWSEFRNSYLENTVRACDIHSLFASLSSTLHLFFQAATLGLGAYLVLGQDLSPGAMIAASILLGRALAPVDRVVGQWLLLRHARQAWRDIDNLMSHSAQPRFQTETALRQGDLCVKDVTLVPPNAKKPALRQVAFTVAPGQALAVAGPCGSGKSALAKALVAEWPVARGNIKFSGIAVAHLGPGARAESLGYLPQIARLYPASIAENIARLSPMPDHASVTTAARTAGIDDLILSLPNGYDTKIRDVDAGLSTGQLRAIALARAIFGQPAFIVLDDPTAHMDASGRKSFLLLLDALRRNGCTIVVLTNDREAIGACDQVLALDQGHIVSHVLSAHQPLTLSARSA